MAWTMEKYPVALKNFGTLLRKKIIQIGNALIDEGYAEERAIPIAISQAKEWLEHASQDEVQAFKATLYSNESSSADLSSKDKPITDNEVVFFDGIEWVVQSEQTEQSAGRFSSKQAALDRAQEVAIHKNGHVLVKKRNS